MKLNFLSKSIDLLGTGENKKRGTMVDSSFWKNKKVLITGHTGFKGSWLSLWLHNCGAKVLGYSLAPSTRPSLFDLAKVGSKVCSVEGDIRNFENFRRVYSDFEPEIVFHLAAQALVRPSYRDPVDTYSTNVMGTVHVLEAARQIPSAGAVVNVTSDKCYENREWAWGYRENEAMGGHDPYSNSKGCAELVASAYRRSYNLKLASARAGNVIGGGDWSVDRLIPDCIRSLEVGNAVQIRNPQSIRPWQHVLEPLSGYLLLAERLYQEPDRFNKGWNFGPADTDAMPVSWIADQMVGQWGNGARWDHVQQKDAPHEAHYLKLDCSLARAELGWKPRLTLETAISWVIEWHKKSRIEPADHVCFEQIARYESLKI